MGKSRPLCRPIILDVTFRMRLAGLCLLLAPSVVWAAGVEFPDNGAVAVGRGGAFSAHPNSALVMHYNPGALADLPGLQVYVDGRVVWEAESFTSPGGATAKDSAPPFVTPTALTVSYDFGAVGPLTHLTAAVGAMGPSATGVVTFPRTGPQRYAIDNLNVSVAYYGAALAVALPGAWRIGATLELLQASTSLSQAWRMTPGNDIAQDVVAHIDVGNTVYPVGLFGVSWSPVDAWTLALSYRMPGNFNGDGTLKLDIPAAFNTTQNGDALTGVIKLPQEFHLAAAYVKPSWELDFEFIYENWTVFKGVNLEPKGITLASGTQTSTLVPVDVVQGFQDAFSLRLGGEYEVLSWLRLRAGYSFETTAIPQDFTNLYFSNWGDQGVGAGATVRVGPFDIDVAYAHHFRGARNVTNSAITQITIPPPGGTAPVPEVVGNGRYTSSIDLVELALRYTWGDPSRT